MSIQKPEQVNYDRYLDVTSFSTFDDEGLFKTWFFDGNQASHIHSELQLIKNRKQVLDMLSRYVEHSYVAHRALKFQRLHSTTHKIELKELNIENYKDPKSLLFHIIDEIYARVKAAPESAEFRISKEVWQNLNEKGWLEILRKYKMAREFKTDHKKQEFTMEKQFELAKARLLAKHMPKENNIKPFDRKKLIGGMHMR